MWVVEAHLAAHDWSQGKSDEAKPPLEGAIEITEKKPRTRPSPRRSWARQRRYVIGVRWVVEALVDVHTSSKGKGDKPHYKRAIEISENELGPDHLNVTSGLSKLAALSRVQVNKMNLSWMLMPVWKAPTTAAANQRTKAAIDMDESFKNPP